MESSKKFMTKFVNDTMDDVTDRKWFNTIYKIVTDSKELTRWRLDNYLDNQIIKPHPKLVEVAFNLFKQSKDHNQLIIKIQNYVIQRVHYVSNYTQYGKMEYWADAYHTWLSRQGDCNCQNTLIYVLARLSGIPKEVIWCAIGDVNYKGKDVGHFWCLYFNPKRRVTGSWFSMDSTYYQDLRPLHIRDTFNFSEHKYKSIWFMFNEDWIFKYK